MSKTKRERVTEREDAIVDAAAAAFLRGGLREARMAQIAEAAGIAEGTLYLYFRNKQALFSAVVARHWERLAEGAGAAVSGADTPPAQLEALALFTLDRIYSEWKLFELSFALQYADDAPADPTDRRSYVRIFDQIVERGIDRGDFAKTAQPRLLRDLFFGTMEYAVRSVLARNGSRDDLAPVIPMLMKAFARVSVTSDVAAEADLAARLESAVTRLESLASR